MKKVILFLLSIIVLESNAQFRRVAPLTLSGPMVSHVELRTASLWMECTRHVSSARVKYYPKGLLKDSASAIFVISGGPFYYATAVLSGLNPGTTYQYEVSINGGPGNIKGEVTTQSLWQYRKPPPDFSFIAGSCTYFNEPVYDRPGKPYGGDSSIFETMAKENSDFMLWLGDNWYTREVDYFSEWGLHYRAAHFKRQPVLRPLFKKMAHYAIWDDHDYGWNNSDKSYPLKATSREVFMKNWSNPSYGENGEGIYTKFTWNDVDVFLLDDRWFRTNDDMPDSIGGKPTEKKMYGDKQMEWLKNALLQSNYNRNVSYRLIVTGSQVLNPLSPFDKFSAFKTEYNDFMNFITASKINGVVFLSGDRHHSEIIKVEREGSYPLFDVTSSPLTSGISRSAEIEKNNPYLVGQQVNVQNYTRFSFSGPIENRKMTVEFLGIKGEKLGEWSVLLKAVSVAK